MASSGRWCGKFGRLVALFAIAAIGLAAPANATSMLWVGGTGGSLGRLVPARTFGTFGDLLGSAYKDARTTTIAYPGSLWPITGLLDPSLGSSVRTGTTRLDRRPATPRAHAPWSSSAPRRARWWYSRQKLT
jgi:hypothetical protein